MHVDDAVFGKLSEPEVKGHGRILEVSRESLGGFQHDVLHDITGIHSTSHRLIKPHLDHPPHGLAVAVHQAIHSSGVSVSHIPKQILGFVGFRPHGREAFAEGR
jgi:hypothetical protein